MCLVLVMRTKQATYLLEDDGRVIDRSNGPANWDYDGRWIITGLKTRFNAIHAKPILDVADGFEPLGHGIVLDYDHGTYRQWGNGRCISIKRVAPGYTVEAAKYELLGRIPANG